MNARGRERAYADALRARDPVAAVAALWPEARPRSAAARARWADGVRMSALLVARLRFERLLRGSAEAEAWFNGDADGFTAAFRRYHRATPLDAFFPADEAALFTAWCARARRRRPPRRPRAG